MSDPATVEQAMAVISPEVFAALMERYLKTCQLLVSVCVTEEGNYGSSSPRVSVNVSLVRGKNTILLEGEDSDTL
jgi:hypothetical protein